MGARGGRQAGALGPLLWLSPRRADGRRRLQAAARSPTARLSPRRARRPPRAALREAVFTSEAALQRRRVMSGGGQAGAGAGAPPASEPSLLKCSRGSDSSATVGSGADSLAMKSGSTAGSEVAAADDDDRGGTADDDPDGTAAAALPFVPITLAFRGVGYSVPLGRVRATWPCLLRAPPSLLLAARARAAASLATGPAPAPPRFSNHPAASSHSPRPPWVQGCEARSEEGPHSGRLQLLRGVSSAFRPGVLTALMGASGAGKTVGVSGARARGEGQQEAGSGDGGLRGRRGLLSVVVPASLPVARPAVGRLAEAAGGLPAGHTCGARPPPASTQTLLDVLAGRKTGGLVTGQVLLNGRPRQGAAAARLIGYCEQMGARGRDNAGSLAPAQPAAAAVRPAACRRGRRLQRRRRAASLPAAACRALCAFDTRHPPAPVPATAQTSMPRTPRCTRRACSGAHAGPAQALVCAGPGVLHARCAP